MTVKLCNIDENCGDAEVARQVALRDNGVVKRWEAL